MALCRPLKKPLVPHTGNGNTAHGAVAVSNAQGADLKSPAFDDDLTASGAKGVLAGLAGHIAGIHVF